MDTSNKALIIICDGLPDRPLSALGNKTPLEAAKTPNLDKICQRGISGLMNSIDIGVRPGSDTAHLAIFGYDPKIYYSGRGPFECLGNGMDVKRGDIAFRANAGTIDETGLIADRRAGRIESTEQLVAELGNIEVSGIQFILEPSLGHRIGMIMRGPGLSPKVSDQDPHETGAPVHKVKPLDDTPEAKFTADVLNKFAKLVAEKLKSAKFNQERVQAGKLPANIILFRGAGSIPEQMPSFEELHGLKAAFAAGSPLYKGIAKSVGMEIIEYTADDGVTGLPNSNLTNKLKKAIQTLDRFDAVFTHIKAADSLAEDGNAEGKVAFIEKIDAAMEQLADRNDIFIALTADHTTSCALKRHTAEPVPILIAGPGILTDSAPRFTERACGQGSLKLNRGLEIMPVIIDLLGHSKLYGA